MKNLLRQPWDRKKWRNGVVRPAIPSVSAALLAFSAVWFAAAAKTLLEGSADFRNWNTDATSVVTVFGVGILCFFPGIIGFLRWAKWRRVSLRLASMPIVIGGTMKGELFMPGSIPDKTPITVKIYNERRTTGGAGRSRRTRTSVIHQDISTVETSVFSMERGLYKMPVEFVIPYDTFDATSNRGDTAYRWRMLVAGSTSGLDINIAMEIPVFKTPQSDSSVKASRFDANDIEQRLSTAAGPRYVKVLREAGEEHYITGGGRMLGQALIGYGISLAMAGGAIYMILAKKGIIGPTTHEIENAPWIMPITLLLLAVVCWLVSANMGARREVWVTGGWLYYKKGKRRPVKIACSDIVECPRN